MRILDVLNEWWDGPPVAVDPTCDKAVDVRTKRVVNGKTVEETQIRVEVRQGVVKITGDVKGLEINGRRVRFREPTP